MERAHEVAVRGGTIVTAGGRREASIFVDQGRITAIGTADEPAQETIDVTGLLILPGMIDGHVHFMDPSEPDREDFVTGTMAAAAGGVTTVIEHTHSSPVREAADLTRKVAYLQDRALVDFGLAAHVWPDRLANIPAVWRAGATFFKIFACTTHGVPGLANADLLAAFRAIEAVDALTLVHCEDESITAANEAVLRHEGGASHLLPRWRSREAELVAINTVGLLSRLTRVRAIVAHTSHAGAVDLAAAHGAAGGNVWIECCPQYLLLDEEEADRHGAYRKFTPPARVRSDGEREAMWQRVAEGPVTHVSSDHAPSTTAHKDRGMWQAPFGLPGVETTLSVLVDAALSGRLSLERVVQLTSAEPSRLYRLSPQKGRLEPGADADLVIVDPHGTRVFRNDLIVSKAGWTPYTGRELRGHLKLTMVRGRTVARDGRPVAAPGWGRFLPGPGAVDRVSAEASHVRDV